MYKGENLLTNLNQMNKKIDMFRPLKVFFSFVAILNNLSGFRGN